MTAERRSILVALLVAGAFFMENLDGTVIATALPQMARSFGVEPVSLNVGITAYLLTLAVLIPISGWVADRYGPRLVFGSAIAVFTLSSLLCGACHGVGEFTAARVLQGIGGAMMVPVGRLAVLRTTAKRDLLRAIATITWPGLVAPILGPPVGGTITQFYGWRWIFYLNLPLGVLGLAITLWLVPRHRGEERRPFDGAGFILSGVACAAMMVGLDMVDRKTIPWALVAGFLGLGFFFVGMTVRHVRRHPHPILDLTALRIPTFAVTIWGGSLFRMAIGATPFLLPLMFQEGFGMKPAQSGLLVLAVFAGNLSMKPATTFILRRFGFRRVLVGNGLATAAMLAACAAFTRETPMVAMFVVLFLGGLGRSMQFTAQNAVGFSEVPEAGMTGANTLSSTVGTLTFGMGIAFGAVALRLVGMGHGGPVTLDDFRLAFLLIGVVCALSVFDSFRLDSKAGAEVSGHAR